MPVTARRQAIKFKVLICAASFALIPQNQRHPCSCCCCPQLVSSCHICSRCHATRSRSPDVHRMDVLSNREQRLSYKGESSVLRVSLLPASQQPARASTFVSAISSQQLSALAPAMLAATRASNSRAKSAPATCVPTQRSNSRANVSPAIRVPTQRQQFACQLRRSNSRATSGERQQRQPTLRPMPSARAPRPRPALLLLLRDSSRYGAIPAIAEPRPAFGFRL